VLERQAVTGTYVQVMTGRYVRAGKGFASLDPEISEMSIAQRRQPLDRDCHGRRGWNDHADVDDRLRRQARHRRAAHVLDGDGHVANNRAHAGANSLEGGWPRRVVVDDDNLRHVSLTGEAVSV